MPIWRLRRSNAFRQNSTGKGPRFAGALFLFFFALGAFSCSSTGPLLPEEIEHYEASLRRDDWTVLSVGRSVEGREILLHQAGDGGERVFVLAGIHGDEPAGIPLLVRLVEELKPQSAWRSTHTLLLMPFANPDGIAKGTRGNVRQVDLNRNFPAENWKPKTGQAAPLSEPESMAIHGVMERWRPHRIISIHQRDAGGGVDYDGPGKELAEAMAGDGPLSVLKLGGRPGSLGSFAGITLGVPIITLELHGRDHLFSEEELWNTYGNTLLRGIFFSEAPPAASP